MATKTKINNGVGFSKKMTFWYFRFSESFCGISNKKFSISFFIFIKAKYHTFQRVFKWTHGKQRNQTSKQIPMFINARYKPNHSQLLKFKVLSHTFAIKWYFILKVYFVCFSTIILDHKSADSLCGLKKKPDIKK